MVRTVDSPRCCATSSTSRLPPLWVSSALRMAGRCPSNCTSTTAPMTCVMRPVWLAGVAIKLSPSNSVSNGGQLDRNVANSLLNDSSALRCLHDTCDHRRNLTLDEGHQFRGGRAHFFHRGHRD